MRVIGLGRIEGPEDVILDRDDNLYAGSRHGDIVRFFPPDYERMEIFAHIGGTPLGMAFDKHDNLYVCIGGMGLYRVTPERKVEKVTDETNRSYASVNDDSRLRLADDLDISDDGRIFFSEATVRYEMHEWATDGLEARGNGRIICYDTRTGKTHTVLRDLKFPNGVCIASDGQSFLFAETWGCTVKRHWFDGPKKGTTELVLDNLPGFPDNINNSSDGQLLDVARRHALPGARSGVEDAGVPPPHGQARAARRMAVPEHQHRLRAEVQRARRGARDAVGPRRREPPDDHLDARAPRPSVPRRHHEQPRRSVQDSGRRPGFVQYERRWRKAA